MFYKRDWILRQIQMLADMIARAVFGTSAIAYTCENETSPTQTDQLFRKLDMLIAQKRIDEAEDCLFDGIEAGNRKHLELAMDFYQKINRFSDEELEKCNFPRQEILDGVNAVIKKFGLTDMEG
ncbi:MAG: hypothetical protein GX417_11545 [Clostridiales bacterium]|nr:hypothetical protein [Clostridiales bacterium]